MRQNHRAGDKLFVDYAGHTISISSPDGPVWQAELFTAVLGASNYTYAEATPRAGTPPNPRTCPNATGNSRPGVRNG